MLAEDGKNIIVSEHKGIIDRYAVFAISENEDELHFHKKICFID